MIYDKPFIKHSIWPKIIKSTLNILDELSSKLLLIWPPFSNKKFTSTIDKCNNLSTLGLDRVLWKYLKTIVKDTECLKNIMNIANACIDLGH